MCSPFLLQVKCISWQTVKAWFSHTAGNSTSWWTPKGIARNCSVFIMGAGLSVFTEFMTLHWLYCTRRQLRQTCLQSPISCWLCFGDAGEAKITPQTVYHTRFDHTWVLYIIHLQLITFHTRATYLLLLLVALSFFVALPVHTSLPRTFVVTTTSHQITICCSQNKCGTATRG